MKKRAPSKGREHHGRGVGAVPDKEVGGGILWEGTFEPKSGGSPGGSPGPEGLQAEGAVSAKSLRACEGQQRARLAGHHPESSQKGSDVIQRVNNITTSGM